MSEAPDERIEGLQRQLAALAALEADGAKVGGWKVGLTSGRARNSMGDGFRPFGYVLADRILHSPATVSLQELGTGGLENELCFTIGGVLAVDASRNDVMAAVDGVSAGYEINQQRLQGDVSTADRLADNLSQWGIVVGETRRLDWRRFDFNALEVTLARDGAEVERVAAAGHIDDHVESLRALVKQLGRFGRRLEPGDRVITGSFTRQAVTAPSRWEGNFGVDIGAVQLEFV